MNLYWLIDFRFSWTIGHDLISIWLLHKDHVFLFIVNNFTYNLMHLLPWIILGANVVYPGLNNRVVHKFNRLTEPSFSNPCWYLNIEYIGGQTWT